MALQASRQEKLYKPKLTTLERMVEIKITYETLFDLLRREKNREELQGLDGDFYEQVHAYLKEKEQLLSGKEDTSYFSNEKEKLKVQFQNIRRLVKELYERREKKIINIALIKARTGSDVIDTSTLLPCELEFFGDLVGIFSNYKGEIVDKIINLREFNGIVKNGNGQVQALRQRLTAVSDEEVSYASSNSEQNPEVHFKEEKPASKKVKILEYLPKFMGLRGEILGPYEKDSVVDLDHQIADILLKKGRAELS
jgi:DNA replication initiation complex subunit (GINS family)